MKPNLGLNRDQITGVAQILTRALADEFILYTKTRNHHWNVVGPQFQSLHLLFEKQYDALAEAVDRIAERIRSLGRPAPGTLSEFLRHARLKEQPGKHPPAAKMIALLLKDHESIIQSLRQDLAACIEDFGDAGTGDFLTGLMEEHEKTAWMLRAHLEKGD
jgi:starvation-inducible DNA-binding protein